MVEGIVAAQRGRTARRPIAVGPELRARHCPCCGGSSPCRASSRSGRSSCGSSRRPPAKSGLRFSATAATPGPWRYAPTGRDCRPHRNRWSRNRGPATRPASRRTRARRAVVGRPYECVVVGEIGIVPVAVAAAVGSLRRAARSGPQSPRPKGSRSHSRTGRP